MGWDIDGMNGTGAMAVAMTVAVAVTVTLMWPRNERNATAAISFLLYFALNVISILFVQSSELLTDE